MILNLKISTRSTYINDVANTYLSRIYCMVYYKKFKQAHAYGNQSAIEML